jgi:hypothetical protein
LVVTEGDEILDLRPPAKRVDECSRRRDGTAHRDLAKKLTDGKTTITVSGWEMRAFADKADTVIDDAVHSLSPGGDGRQPIFTEHQISRILMTPVHRPGGDGLFLTSRTGGRRKTNGTGPTRIFLTFSMFADFCRFCGQFISTQTIH